MKANFTKLLLCVALITSSTILKSQNLVPNGGFEVQDSCPDVSEIQVAKPWITCTYGSPDLFNSSCTTQNHPAHTGIGCSGVFVYSGDSGWNDNREYMEAQLLSALQAGKTYWVSFWVQPANYKLAVNRMGAWFSNSLYMNMSTSSNLPYTPQVQNSPSRPLNSASWMQITGSFVASGGESYIVIGNLAPDAQTTTYIYKSTSPFNDAFLFVDDVWVSLSGVGIEEAQLAASFHVYPNPASDVASIQFPENVSVQSLKLINASGQVVMNDDLKNHFNREYTIKTSDYAAGVYYISITANDMVINKQLMIVK